MPSPAEIRAARKAAGLTQTQAGALVGRSMRAWQDWESGARNMPTGLAELFRRRVEAGEHINAREPGTTKGE